MKTAVVMECRYTNKIRTPRADCIALKLGNLPASTTVTFGYHDSSLLLDTHRIVYDYAVDGEQANLIYTTILLGKVVMQVFTDTHGVPEPALTERGRQMLVPLVAGNRTPVGWPPAVAMDVAAYSTARGGLHTGAPPPPRMPPDFWTPPTP